MGANRILQIWAPLAFLWGACLAGPQGTDFILVFMQNNEQNFNQTKFQVMITGYEPNTSVIITSEKIRFKKNITVNDQQTISVQIPSSVEVSGTIKPCKSVIIQADGYISVVSNSYKSLSADTGVVYPITILSREYYLTTPNGDPSVGRKEFAIANHQDANSVEVHVKGSLSYEGNQYNSGDILVLSFQAFEAAQFQSTEDLTGTRIVAMKPIAVWTGHSCMKMYTECSHVYEQLQPVLEWDNTFIVPSLSYQTNLDKVYVVASEPTQVKYQTGNTEVTKNLVDGQFLLLDLKPLTAYYISSDKGIQVMLAHGGWDNGNGVTYAPFLMSIPAIESYCTAYYVYGQLDFENRALMIAKTSETDQVAFDKKPLKSVKWKPIAGTGYSWGEYNFGQGLSFHLIDNTNSAFGVLNFGTANGNGYGSLGICTPNNPGSSCDTMMCRKMETCKILNGQPECVPDSEAVCWGWGDPHYHSFDNKSYEFQGTCTYTIAKYCGNDAKLPDFSIEVKNENRGNTKVAYFRSMTIRIYGYTISVVRFEYGFVRVDNQLSHLPITLNNGKLQLFQTGNSLLIQTDFSLKVYCDWNHYFKVEISSSYFESVCGLCGNYNGNPNDDFMTPDMTVAANAIDFGKSWVVEDGDQFCWHDCNGECQTCSQDLMTKYENELICGLITEEVDGPFKECHSVIDPKMYIDSCVYDMCMTDGYQQSLCQALKTYADACQRKNIVIYEWREIAGCPMDCPENSQYKTCGSACPATCNDDAATQCTESCVETCECQDGFVLNEGKCVNKSSCGCVFEGRIYAANERFWADQTCNKQCLCNPETKEVECRTTRCKTGEICDVVKGIQDCYPSAYGTCSASGDPHFITFDKLKYDFQGTCYYLFVGLLKKRDGLTDFQVYIQNENRGHKRVSYLQLVEFVLPNYNLLLSNENPDKVMVNGILYNIPYSINNTQIRIYQDGNNRIIQTKKSLRVAYNPSGRISVTIPKSYAGAVGGLCGDFNGDGSNELTMKDGTITTDATAFGDSWKVKDIPGCTDPYSVTCPEMATIEILQRDSKGECGILLDEEGPFRECHAKIDPEGFFLDCVYDYCFYKGRQDATCKVISSYATACQDAGGTLYEWRSASFCSPSCPENSYNEICIRGCAPTCASLLVPIDCDANCKEGCICKEGFVFSGAECVPMAQCGCSYNAIYYKSGEVFFPSGLCNQQCTCIAGGAVECKDVTCGPDEECKVIDGIHKCQAIGSAQCQAVGGLHYLTFDDLPFDLQSMCAYTLTKTITEDSNLVPFAVHVENKKFGSGEVTVIKTVSIDIYDQTLSLLSDTEGLIMVNGEYNNLPYTLENGNIRAYQNGMNVIISTAAGIEVSFDRAYSVVVAVPGNYKSQLGGLCGNYNGDKNDEFQLPDMSLAADATTFGSAWKVQVAGVTCDPGCGSAGNPCSACEDKKKKVFKQENYCGILTSFDGPFSACYFTVNPDVYYNNCIDDLCKSNGDSRILCLSIQSYVAACQSAGVAIQPWRSDSFCPLDCPANSQYKLNADTCSVTCAGLTDPAKCPTTSAEGCECNDGFFFDGQQCVSVENCGCFQNGRYYRPNEMIVRSDCKEICSCDPTGNVACEDYSCASNETCDIRDGIVGCINQDPCKSANCRTKETCMIQDGKPKCVPNYIGICTAWGDPHYSSLDGYSYDFQGTCTYTLATYTGSDPTLVPFVINAKNDNRGNQAVSYVQIVTVSVYGQTISIQKGEVGKIRINGIITNLPASLEDGKIQLVQMGFTAVLIADFGLMVTFDWDMYMIFSIPSSYYGNMGGICGNFNQNPEDDMISLDGTKAASVVEWAASWMVNDRDPFCFHECSGTCPTCEESERKLYESEEYCGLITKVADGAFRDCHTKISPENFFDGCVYDVCLNGGAKQFLCQALSVYASTCRKQGVTIYDWRTPAGCPLPCPENSHYEPCGNACPATCSDRSAPSSCTEPCMETCQCNTSFVLSVDKCVPINSCGCSYKGLYYLPNEEFWDDDNCHVLCKCDPSLGMVVCKNTNCKSSEKCTVVNGIRGCHPISYSTCIAHGDPHFATFDDLTYDFMGTCIYRMVEVTSKDKTLTPFTVDVENNNRGNNAVSFAKTVTFQAYDITITMSQEYPQKIKVNGIFTDLPYSYENGKITASLSGPHTVVLTDFGVRASFDAYSYVTVKIPSTYANAVRGLCGNNNKNSNDDMTMKNGNKASTAVEFGDSWKVGDVAGCTAGCTVNCPVYTEAQKAVYKTEEFCGLIIEQTGPFSECFKSIDPKPFFNSCVFDASQYKGHYSSFCSAISAYVSSCQTKGIEILPWRNDSFCSLACPPNMSYELNGNGCPVTCNGLSSPVGCNEPPREGCYCNNGFILSGDKCVPINECGCKYNDLYYTLGAVFYTSDLCKKQCQCKENGIVECNETSCGANEECTLVNGVQGCHPDGYGTCIASGTFHYSSFDGLASDFPGTCSYTLASVISDDPRLEKFSIVVNSQSYDSGSVTVTRTVTVSVYNSLVTIEQGIKWKVKVDGEIIKLPAVILDKKVWINQEGNNIVLQTLSGLKILCDTGSFMLVSIPSTYKGKVGGFCGNFNDDTTDDYMLPNGQVTTSVDEFIQAWKMPGLSGSCSDGCGDKCPVCNSSNLNLNKGVVASCGMITDSMGPFKDCHTKVDPAKYFDYCIYDMCVMEGQGDILCKSLQAYMTACQAVGATIKTWRTPSFCSVKCPAFSRYQMCTETCDYTCASLSALSTCTQTCFEGCQCNAGYLFDGGRCVSMKKCGAVYEGTYLSNDQNIVTSDCSQRCSSSSGGITCQSEFCQTGEICTVKRGVRDCFKEDAQCTLAMGALFTSFDGLSGQVTSIGSYEVASLSDVESAFWFRVVFDTQFDDGNQSIADKVFIFFQNVFISVTKNKDTWVNGQKVQLPTQISNSISVKDMGNYVIIEQSDQLKVFFSTNGEVTVNVSGMLANAVSGACGNFNENSSDDLMLSTGETAQSISEVFNSWRAPDLCNSAV